MYNLCGKVLPFCRFSCREHTGRRPPPHTWRDNDDDLDTNLGRSRDRRHPPAYEPHHLVQNFMTNLVMYFVSVQTLSFVFIFISVWRVAASTAVVGDDSSGIKNTSVLALWCVPVLPVGRNPRLSLSSFERAAIRRRGRLFSFLSPCVFLWSPHSVAHGTSPRRPKNTYKNAVPADEI